MKKLASGILIIAALVLAGSIAYDFYKTTATPDSEAIKLMTPKDAETSKTAPGNPKSTVTILLGSNKFIFAYQGSDMSNGKMLDSTTIREYLIKMKNEIPKNDFVVIIKKSPDAPYQNTVDMLDEMAMNNIKRYAIADIFKSEKRIIDSLNKQ